MNNRHRLKVNRHTGQMEWLTPPPFKLALTQQKRERFSVIEPVNLILRLWFRLLRRLFGEDGSVAESTRRWACTWKASLLTGPNRGASLTSRDRSSLLKWEDDMWFS